jgi:hypothetical protein
VNDKGKPQNDPVQPDERARELIEQLNLLEAVDRRITPEHVAQRFHELLRSAGPSAPGTARSARGSRPAADTYRRRFSRFLLTLAGALPEIVDRTPEERVKLQSLGWAILITSGVAAVSMWFALTAAMGVNGFAAVLVALAWGLVIMGVDKWLVTSMPVDSTRRKLAVAAPRFLLAVFLGTLISTPFVLRIFQPEINAEIAVIRQQQFSEFLTGHQHGQLVHQADSLQARVNDLDQIIASGGQVSVNPAADPQTQSLITQRTHEIELEQKYYQQFQCQLNGGGPGCPTVTAVGAGPAALAAKRSYDQAAAQVSNLTNEIQNRERQLTANGAVSAKDRLQQAQEALPTAQHQLDAVQAQLDSLQESFKAQNNSDNGLLIRLEALNRMAGNSLTVNAARLLLFLMFLLIECLPVTVKLLQPGDYEKIRARETDMRLKISLIQEGLQRQRRVSGQEGHLPPGPRPQDTMPAQTSSGTGPLEVSDDLKREIENIYAFMEDTNEAATPGHREELENCFRAISEGVNELLRRGYDNEQITEALRIAGDMVTRQLAVARQAAVKELSS